jgi:septum formation protein
VALNQNYPKIILASQSQRRKQLLAEADLEFEVIPPDDAAESGFCSGESPSEMVVRLARQKAENVAAKIDKGIVLAADTVAECVGQVLGKPKDVDQARQMLQLMRGREHRVLTGVCFWQRPENRIASDVGVTQLTMDPLTDDEIEDYLDTDQWIGKAGAFGYQDGLDWVHIKDGEASNVVGLPMAIVRRLLEELLTNGDE